MQIDDLRRLKETCLVDPRLQLESVEDQACVVSMAGIMEKDYEKGKTL